MTADELLEIAAESHLDGKWPQFAELTQDLLRFGMQPPEIMRKIREINGPRSHFSGTNVSLPSIAGAVYI